MTTQPTWTWPPEFLESLAGFGLAPGETTPPALVHEALDDLYRYELRRLRRSLGRGEVARTGYADRVVALRKRYWLLTLPLPAWERICRPPHRP